MIAAVGPIVMTIVLARIVWRVIRGKKRIWIGAPDLLQPADVHRGLPRRPPLAAEHGNETTRA